MFLPQIAFAETMDSTALPQVQINPMEFLSAFLAMGIWVMLFGIAMYILSAWLLYRVAKKLNLDNLWMVWVPIANLFAVVKMALLPWWWGLIAIGVCLIPGLGQLIATVLGVYFFWLIAKRLNKPEWYAILLLVPIVNLFIMYDMGK